MPFLRRRAARSPLNLHLGVNRQNNVVVNRSLPIKFPAALLECFGAASPVFGAPGVLSLGSRQRRSIMKKYAIMCRGDSIGEMVFRWFKPQSVLAEQLLAHAVSPASPHQLLCAERSCGEEEDAGT